MTVQFSLPGYEKLKESELKSLTTTAQDLFYVLAEFARYNNVKTEVNNELKIELNNGRRWVAKNKYKHVRQLPTLFL